MDRAPTRANKPPADPTEKVRAVSIKQDVAMYEIYKTLTALETEFHNTHLGPRQGYGAAKTGGDLRDITVIRTNIDDACHTRMEWEWANEALKGLWDRWTKYYIEEIKKSDANSRWGKTRTNIKATFKDDPVRKEATLKRFEELIENLRKQMNVAIVAFGKDRDFVLTRANLVTPFSVNKQTFAKL
ncbi:hypothetical protein M011DRAFT_299246 [Sporormia fimetaria CBS 119925]|uniref:Uncharacterized protein n=1 Tax=Sporormia fimetaria CBS 119925 TaxID=1340428 RepID=A0A6A6UWU3_9PLEO|nr:hypothetical protein M011DRAFT_299246 [Sporormia fimetaria CBS 119925]